MPPNPIVIRRHYNTFASKIKTKFEADENINVHYLIIGQHG